MVAGFTHYPLVAAGVLAITVVACVVILFARRRRGGASLWPQHWTARTVSATVVGLVAALAVILGAMVLLYPS